MPFEGLSDGLRNVPLVNIIIDNMAQIAQITGARHLECLYTLSQISYRFKTESVKTVLQINNTCWLENRGLININRDL